LPKLMEPLAALAHQTLAAGQAELPIGSQRPGQTLKALPVWLSDASNGVSEGPGHKGAKALLTSLEIPKPPLRLQLQGLLQGLEPSLQRLLRQGVGCRGGLDGGGLGGG